MPSVKFGAPKKRTTRKKAEQVTHPALVPTAPEPPGATTEQRVMAALATFALLIESRRDLAGAMDRASELDGDAINDPANDSHPGIDRIRDEYQERTDREERAWRRAIELANGIGGIWQHMTPEDRRRSGLATLLGMDMDQPRILFELWNAGTHIDVLAPLPGDWAIPSHLSHIVGKEPGSVESYTVEMPPF